MRLTLALSFAILLSTVAIAQDQDIQIFEKKDGNKNIVVARNVGKVSYLVTLSIDATGMDVIPGIELESVVPAGYMKELATLTPRPGQAWSYGYDVSFVEYTGQEVKSTPNPSPNAAVSAEPSAPVSTPKPQAPSAVPSAGQDNTGIIIYTQAGCGRCAFVRKEMTAKGIAYHEVDVNSGSPEVNDMWKKLRDGGFNGDSVTMPVVSVKGELHYNIKDLQGFVNGIKI
mgnify:FL=1